VIVGVDMDGPVADLHTEWYMRYNRDYNDTLDINRVTHWDLHKFVKPECGTKIYDYLRDPDLYEHVPAVKGALETIEKLREAGNEIVFVTAGVLGNLDQKLNWLKQHKFLNPGSRDMRGVIFAYDKQLIRVQLLIDDGPHNIASFGGTGIVWDAPYNQGVGKYRIKSWADMPALWEKLYG